MTTETDDILDLSLDNSEIDLTELHMAMAITAAHENLLALSDILKKESMSEALLHFADHEGILSEIMPEIPSLEDFHENPQSFDIEAAQEALLNRIVATTKRWLSAIKGAITRFKRYIIHSVTFVTSATAAIVLIQKAIESKDHSKFNASTMSGLLASANNTMLRLEHRGSAAKEAFDVRTIVLKHFGAAMSPTEIVHTCLSNTAKVGVILKDETINIDDLEKMASRLEGASHPDQVARQREVHEKLSASRMFVSLLLRTVRDQKRVAHGVENAYAH